MATPPDPHADQPVLHRGPAVRDARLVAILIHGRGGSAEDILGLATAFNLPDVAYLAPQAAGHTWYPYPFMSALDRNEPWLTSALRRVATLAGEAEAQGIPRQRLAIMGFSQGACLTLEFTARHAQRYAAVAAFSGGVIGPAGTPRDYAGSFDGTPVFLGCSDIDPHIPVERVRESSVVFQRMGAAVDERIYPGMGHSINADEIAAVKALLTAAMRDR